ncbi:ABC transporter ATP-binding protein [Commensalibacter communis]|uniref:ABC transporter ATP-binding protein n=1 Tax=Commensalibacter communis TaxID=2972786 RepID=UPI0022FF90ED|nr:ATP-binding cassette domain-containing protein [Commensalibacter communis]CAI3959869.1 ATPase subunit MlaF of the ABC-type intermembrane phospholipid transporter Mla (MlaF) (PDB:6IC4) [Commensalibacter communis]CAI3959932.1 ATPase subunit MlaF of the ABC-type intermembrane phospholipid transporter Mla (MlaF) (PDB:6IC4) [Commensalibacter communis]
MTQSVPKIRIRNLSKSFGSNHVLRDVSMDVETGTSFVIIGGSGSGKSVLLRCILGLMVPDSGSIEIDGQNIFELSSAQRNEKLQQMGMLFQNAALFDSLPIWQNVAFALLYGHRKNKPKVSRHEAYDIACDVLKLVGLDPTMVSDLYPDELSGGMQKRVGLARAIASKPGIIFFDEPTTGLDPIMGAVIDELIKSCVDTLGSTAIAITHDMASAQRIGDHAAMLYKGELIWQGKAKDLLMTDNPYVHQFTHGLRQGPIKVETKVK